MIKITWDRNGYWTLYEKSHYEICKDIILASALRLDLKPLKIEENHK